MSVANPIVGLRYHRAPGMPLQVILKNGDRSDFDDSLLSTDSTMFWVNSVIPKDSIIHFVDMYYKLTNENLEALRGLDENGKVLAAAGRPHDLAWHNDPDFYNNHFVKKKI
jgi:hypothetical protein